MAGGSERRRYTKTKTHGVRGQWVGCISPVEAGVQCRGEFHQVNAYKSACVSPMVAFHSPDKARPSMSVPVVVL